MSAPNPTPLELAHAFRLLTYKLAAMQLRSKNLAERLALDELINLAQTREVDAKNAASEVKA